MYLLDTPTAFQLFSRDEKRPIYDWIKDVEPEENDLYISVITLGQMSHMIESVRPPKRQNWRRLLQEGRRNFETAGGIISIDQSIVDAWQSALRGELLAHIQGAKEVLGEDDRLIIATAIAKELTLVTEQNEVIESLTDKTALTAVYV